MRKNIILFAIILGVIHYLGHYFAPRFGLSMDTAVAAVGGLVIIAYIALGRWDK